MDNNFHIVHSENYKNEFFIFRENGEEVHCYFDRNKKIQSKNFKITSAEKVAINKKYKNNGILKFKNTES